MALATDEKAVVQEVVDAIKAIKLEIRDSIPMRSTGASHIYNTLGPLEDKLKTLLA